MGSTCCKSEVTPIANTSIFDNSKKINQLHLSKLQAYMKGIAYRNKMMLNDQVYVDYTGLKRELDIFPDDDSHEFSPGGIHQIIKKADKFYTRLKKASNSKTNTIYDTDFEKVSEQNFLETLGVPVFHYLSWLFILGEKELSRISINKLKEINKYDFSQGFYNDYKHKFSHIKIAPRKTNSKGSGDLGDSILMEFKQKKLYNLFRKSEMDLLSVVNYDTELHPLFTEFGRPYFFSILELYKKLQNLLVNHQEASDKMLFEGYVNKLSKEKIDLGFLIGVDEQERAFKYYGYFKSDKFHGVGLLVREDGYKYAGEFREGKRTGYGEETTAGWKYKGLFLDGKFHGYGEFVVEERKNSTVGCFYKGEPYFICFARAEGQSNCGFYSEGKLNGFGYISWSVNDTYLGYIKDNEMHGKGKRNFTSGDFFIGNYVRNLKEGYGTYYFKKQLGASLSGMWTQGMKEGEFVLKNRMKKEAQVKMHFKHDKEVG